MPRFKPEYWCENCKEPCSVVQVDFGIGFYEYWGVKSVDVQMRDCSDCCEADITLDDPNEDDDEIQT